MRVLPVADTERQTRITRQPLTDVTSTLQDRGKMRRRFWEGTGDIIRQGR
jgi:hypothetical protein